MYVTLENVVADIMSRLCSITTDTRIALSDISYDQVERIQGIPTLLASLSSTRIDTPLPWQLRNKPDDIVTSSYNIDIEGLLY